ncbi:MAG: nitroreductase [Gammaproteobacteria bacterium]|nr:nitroreductase [Gammaproteobacteria bacterium]
MSHESKSGSGCTSGVQQAVSQRHSVRAFTEQGVPHSTLQRIFTAAAQAPSGGNLQPWQTYVLTGDDLATFLQRVAASIEQQPMGEDGAYDIYPHPLIEPYRSRRAECGDDLYKALGIEREDKFGRITQVMKNFEFFGAPVGVFFAIDKSMGRPQWAHLGMYIQTVMLLAIEEGLASCPQEAWSMRHQTVREHLGMPDDLELYCGLALGYEDVEHPINQFRTTRVPINDNVTFRGF